MSAFGMASYTGNPVANLSPKRSLRYRQAMTESIIASEEGQPPAEPPTPQLTPQEQVMGFVKALSVFLPAEILTLYAALVAASQPDPKDNLPAVIDLNLWIVALILAPILAFATATWAGNDVPTRNRKATVAFGAFILWSASVPASAVYLLPWFRLDEPSIALAFAGIVLIFTGLAKWWLDARTKEASNPAPPDEGGGI